MQAERVGNLLIMGPAAGGLTPAQAALEPSQSTGIDINGIANLMLTMMVMAMMVKMMGSAFR